MIYHKLSALVTGDDGREWKVSVEPPLDAPGEGKPTSWDVLILHRPENGEKSAGYFEHTVTTHEGMFKALSLAVELVPTRK